MKRRDFLKVFTGGGLAAAVIPRNISAQSLESSLILATWTREEAVREAYNSLNSGRNPLDAVIDGIQVEEDNPENHSVGYGGLPDRDGNVTLDACVSYDYRSGSVAGLKNIRHAARVAKAVRDETPHVMLVGDGAYQFAIDQGFIHEDLLTLEAREMWQEWCSENDYTPRPVGEHNHDTIGMLVLDSSGRIAGACSTSGKAYKLPGRVGDSPLIGAGLYVDPEVGGATATGDGELIIETSGASRIVSYMKMGMTPEEACYNTCKDILTLNSKRGEEPSWVGLGAINVNGEHGFYSTKGCPYTVARDGNIELLSSSRIIPPSE